MTHQSYVHTSQIYEPLCVVNVSKCVCLSTSMSAVLYLYWIELQANMPASLYVCLGVTRECAHKCVCGRILMKSDREL